MMSSKLSSALRTIVFGAFAAALPLSFGPSALAVGQDRGGADTYDSQMQESFVIAAQIMGKTETLSGLPEHLNQAFLSHKERWMARLNARPSLIDSDKPLLIDGAEKAAVADMSKGHIEISLPYWAAHPVSMVQSIVLAVHEAGHLEKIPLTHRELDQIGFALVRQNMKSHFGSTGFQKLSETRKDLSPREKVQVLFDDSNASATLDDFSYGKAADWGRKCIVYPANQNIQYSHSVWFQKVDLETAPDSPLFPGGRKLTTVHSAFEKLGIWHVDSNPANNRVEQTESGLKIVHYANPSTDTDFISAFEWFRYEFRRSGDLIVFKLNVGDSPKDSYGFCWEKK
jgi:hypothetical protein